MLAWIAQSRECAYAAAMPSCSGTVIIFRVFAARWLGLSIAMGSCLLLDTATLNILGYYRESPALKRWNARFPA